ncbi:putative T7SS-secreted protein [Streptomyces sp. YIM 98790]|uniref:putative T7SS-secreted protein n=1 Tax=Streptomyces sp. YIM 98790 TaxID=2689077 RepID=UPI00140E6216|nr:hypothetical protein [Streptomyces sp. YIM 98790]
MRAKDWTPLTEDGKDPVPGDWEAVKDAAEQYAGMADLIRRCSDTLVAVDEDSQCWVGESANAFREHATDLGDRLGKAHGRYETTAEALDTYWPVLRDAQEESEELRRQAVAAQETIDTYGPKAEEAEDEDSEFHDQCEFYQEQCSTAESCLQGLRTRLGEIVAEKNAAAAAAAEDIRDFIKNDGLKNKGGFWQGLQDVLGTIGTVAGKIAGYAGMAALVLGWVPILGQALALIAIVGTALSLVGNLVNGNWKGVALDTLGLLAPGIGRAVGKLATAAGKMNKLKGYSTVLQRGKGSLNRATRTRNAQEAMGATKTQLRNSATQARTASPNSLSSFGRETFEGVRDQFLFRGGGPTPGGVMERAGDIAPLVRSGQWGLAASTTAAHTGYAAVNAGGAVIAANSVYDFI